MVRIMIRYEAWPDAPQWTVTVAKLKPNAMIETTAVQQAWSPGMGLDYCLADLGLITLPHARPVEEDAP